MKVGAMSTQTKSCQTFPMIEMWLVPPHAHGLTFCMHFVCEDSCGVRGAQVWDGQAMDRSTSHILFQRGTVVHFSNHFCVVSNR